MDEQIPLSGIPCLAPSVGHPSGQWEASFFNECFCCENTGVEPDFGEEFTVPASMLCPCVAYSKGLLLHFPVGYPAQIRRNHFSISA